MRRDKRKRSEIYVERQSRMENLASGRPTSPNDRKRGQESLLEVITNAKPAPRELAGVVVGTLAAVNDSGVPLVDFPANPSREHVPSRSVVALGTADVGREVAILFEEGDASRPMVIGLMEGPQIHQAAPRRICEAELDGERLVLSAEKEVVLRCGKASITLTRAGKILIRGAHLLSRSSGVNRIKGGSVQIN